MLEQLVNTRLQDVTSHGVSGFDISQLLTACAGEGAIERLVEHYDRPISANGPAPWLAFSQIFTATTDSTLLKFIATKGAINAGIYLDYVSVTPFTASVPEPLTSIEMAETGSAVSVWSIQGDKRTRSGWAKKAKIPALLPAGL